MGFQQLTGAFPISISADIDRCHLILRPYYIHSSRFPISSGKFPRLWDLRNHKLCFHHPIPTVRRQSWSSSPPHHRKFHYCNRSIDTWLNVRGLWRDSPQRICRSHIWTPEIRRHNIHLRRRRCIRLNLGHRR